MTYRHSVLIWLTGTPCIMYVQYICDDWYISYYRPMSGSNHNSLGVKLLNNLQFWRGNYTWIYTYNICVKSASEEVSSLLVMVPPGIDGILDLAGWTYWWHVTYQWQTLWGCRYNCHFLLNQSKCSMSWCHAILQNNWDKTLVTP